MHLHCPLLCGAFDPTSCLHPATAGRREERSRYEEPPPFVDAPGTTAITNRKDVTPRLFTYAELYIGSRGFSDDELLGSGGFGRVYRAVFPWDESVVAVKLVAGGDTTGRKSLEAELAVVTRIRHRNLVHLRGWCVHEQQLLLVYDYMPNRSLDRLLFPGGGSRDSCFLGWEQRRHIVAGLANALLYLHEQLDMQVIHRDVKASNVLVDSNYDARLGDFGLARWLNHDAVSKPTSPSRCSGFRLTDTSRIGGTVGYLSPESFEGKGSVTTKSDVFSFGIVALELATGRRAVDLTRVDEQIMLLDWVRRLADEGNLSAAVDRRLPKGSDLQHHVPRLLHIGLLCSLHNPLSRPSMKWVTEVLSSDGYNGLPPLPTFKCQPNYYLSLSSSNVSTITGTDKGDHPTPRRRPFPTVDVPREMTPEEISAISDVFSDARKVTVNRLGITKRSNLRAHFAADELRNVGRLRHRNLVQIRGWCMEKGETIVVYEGSSTCKVLARQLFHPRGGTLPWGNRYGITRSLASAILYLHEGWEEKVIHRNITSSAVFLDCDLNPRLGCFGCSAGGVFGYTSPEYVESGESTEKGDVYSFGVVVLEVVTGEKAVDLRYSEMLLVRRVRGLLRRREMEEAADRRLEGRWNRAELRRLVMVGLVCTNSEPECRPSMREVVRVLDGNDELLEKFWGRREGLEERNGCFSSLSRRVQAIGVY